MFKKYLSVAAILVAWVVAVISRLGWNGLLYGLNFGIFQPDGIYYSFKTLMYLNFDSTRAAQLVTQWFTDNSAIGQFITSQEFLTTWGTYPPERILYPILSVPFVTLLGLSGMLIIPIFSLLVLQFSIYWLGVKLKQRILGTILAVLITFSPTTLRWMISSGPDSLLVALFCLIPFALIGSETRFSKYSLFLIIFATSFTRFCLPIWLSIILISYLRNKSKTNYLYLAASIVASIPALTRINTFTQPNESTSFISRLLQIPISFVKIGFVEVAQLAVLDRFLLVFILLALIFSIRSVSSESSKYFLSVGISVWLLGSINGSLGVNFRYQLPLLIFAIWVILENLPRYLTFHAPHVKSKETQE